MAQQHSSSIVSKPYFAGIALLATVALFIGIGTVIFRYLEHLGWIDALFFAVVTATTVGYGNITPHTPEGKLFTVLYIFISIVVVSSFVNHFSNRTKESNLIKRFFSSNDKKS